MSPPQCTRGFNGPLLWDQPTNETEIQIKFSTLTSRIKYYEVLWGLKRRSYSVRLRFFVFHWSGWVFVSRSMLRSFRVSINIIWYIWIRMWNVPSALWGAFLPQIPQDLQIVPIDSQWIVFEIGYIYICCIRCKYYQVKLIQCENN